MGMRKRHPWTPVFAAVLFAAVMIWFLSSVGNLARDSGEMGRRQLENALRRSAAACYAAEGIYPPTLDYLVEHYGVRIEDEYIVFYENFASNLMPDITVLEKGAK